MINLIMKSSKIKTKKKKIAQQKKHNRFLGDQNIYDKCIPYFSC